MNGLQGIQCGERNVIKFGVDPYHHANCPIGNPAITQQIMTDINESFRLVLQ